MNVNIVNFGYRRFRYFPVMELFIADALTRLGPNRVRIFTIMIDDNFHDYIDKIKESGEDSVTIIWETVSSKSVSYIKNAMEFIKTYKRECNIPVMIGGYWASTVSKYFEEFAHFDYIIMGYSIEKIAESINDWERAKKTRSVAAMGQVDWDGYDINLEYLEDPDKYFHKPSGFLSGYLSTFGCPNACGFCFNTVLKNKCETDYTERSIEKVKADINILDGYYHFKKIQFKDLNFFYNTDRAFLILDYLKGRGKTIDGALDITIKDSSEEIFRKIRDYAITDLWIGLESFNPDSLKKMDKDYNPKKVEKVFSWADKYGINLFGNIILGAPWQDREYIEKTIKKSLAVINQHSHVFIMFNSMRPIVGSPIQEKYFPNFHKDINFYEMVDVFSFYLDKIQGRFYSDKFDFINFEKVHNAFWYINRLKIIENRPYMRMKGFIRGIRKIFEKQLKPPYFRSKTVGKLLLLNLSQKNKGVRIISWMSSLLQIPGYIRSKCLKNPGNDK